MSDKKEVFTYAGKCDTIKEVKTLQWRQFRQGELIEGREYPVIGSLAAQWSWVMKDGTFQRDETGGRDLYKKIQNENELEIYVWEGFSKENTNL